MITRRTLLAAGLTTGGIPADEGAGQSSRGGNTDERMVKALEEIRDQLRLNAGGTFPELSAFRTLQRDFLKTRGKYPDFIEVGADVWDALADWHVRTRQPIQVQRTADGRYAMALFQTNAVLRHDVQASYIGAPYDAK
jgi:hypothetical protein